MHPLDIIFPRNCEICGNNLLYGKDYHGICPGCFSRLETIQGERCSTCGRPLISEMTTCTICRERHYDFTRNVSVFEYEGVVRQLIHAYKFNRRKELSLLFAGFLYTVYAEHFEHLPIVPVPGRKESRKKQGWEHIETVLSVLDKSYGVPLCPVLRRTGSKAQKTLSFEDRKNNLNNTISPHITGTRLFSSVVLLDDVFTTGATAQECTRVLHAMGAGDVHIMTLAID